MQLVLQIAAPPLFRELQLFPSYSPTPENEFGTVRPRHFSNLDLNTQLDTPWEGLLPTPDGF